MLHATVQRSCLLLAATAARHHVQVGSWPSLSQERIKGSQYFRLDARIFLMRLSFKSYPCLAVRTFHAVEGLVTVLGRLMNSESTPCQSVWKLCREGALTWGRGNLNYLSVLQSPGPDFKTSPWNYERIYIDFVMYMEDLGFLLLKQIAFHRFKVFLK